VDKSYLAPAASIFNALTKAVDFVLFLPVGTVNAIRIPRIGYIEILNDIKPHWPRKRGWGNFVPKPCKYD
jgi:hypothetical protein